MIAQFDVKQVRDDMKRRYQSVGVMSGLTFYDWVARMFPKNLGALGEKDRPERILSAPVLAETSKRVGEQPRPAVHADQCESSDARGHSRGGQKPFDRKAYMEEYMKTYRRKPVVCPACGHTFTKLKRAKE